MTLIGNVPFGNLILPSIAMGTIPLAVVARMTRSSLLEVLKEDYIRTAKSKGLSPFYVICKHALRNALVPITTVIGLMFGSIITGGIGIATGNPALIAQGASGALGSMGGC